MNKTVDKKDITKIKLYLISKYRIINEMENTIQKSYKTKKMLYFIQAVLNIMKQVYQNKCFKLSEYFINEKCLDCQSCTNFKYQCFKEFLKVNAGNYMLFDDIERLRQMSLSDYEKLLTNYLNVPKHLYDFK
jgi:hypothetical protein